MPYRRFLWPVLGLLAATVVGLVATSLGDNLTYYLTPSEAVAARQTGDPGRFRLGGQVVAGSVVDQGDVKRFLVTDGVETVAVTLAGPTPPLFAEGIGVVVEGTWNGSEFAADLALVRHDENYEPPAEQ